MPDRKVYPRPPAPTQADSYRFRPSSPVNQQSNSSPRSFFSRSPKPPKPKTEVSKIPWESSQPASPIPSTSSPPQSNPSTVARPASPHSIYSYTSSNSSSRWSHGRGAGRARTRGASAGSSPQDVFRSKRGNSDSHFERGGSIGGLGGWSEDEEDIPLSGSGSGRKGSGGKRGMMRQAFGLEKKASNFSLRGLIRRGWDSFDQEFSPPPSPTSPFQPLMQRQQSSPELAKNQNLNSRPSPRSPLLPLPISPSRDRTVSSPTTYPSPESAGVKGKAARLLGEEIVPHGKAARLLGVERKPTLRTRPSVTSLAEASFQSNDDGREAKRSQPPSEEVSFTGKIFDSPSSLGSLPPPPSISTENSPSPFTTPQSASPTMSPPSKTKHRYNNSASDPFWQSDLAQQHQTTLRGHTPLEDSIKEEEDQLEPFPSLPLEARLSLDIPQSSSGLAPSFPPSDPTDSVYISDSPNRSSLYSFSLDLNHLSTFSSMTNFRSLNEEDSPVENLISRSNSPNPLPRLRSSIENQSRRSQNSSSSHSARFSYSPTTSSSARGSSSRLSHNPYSSTNPRHSVSMTAVTLGAPILPAPSSALPPLPNVVANSNSVPSLTSAPSSPPPKQSLPPLPADSAPRIPSLLPLPPFLSLASFPSPPSSPPSPESPSRQVSKPTRSNTLASVASAGTRRRQQANALEALEGRRADSSAGNQKLVTAEGGEERGSRKRAAGVRQQNRAVQQKIEGEVVRGEIEEIPRKKDESFLDLDGSDVEAGAGEEEEEEDVKEEGEVEGTKQSLGEFQTERKNSAQSISGLPLLVAASLTRRQSISSLSSIDSRTSDSSLFSTLPMEVTASSFPRPPSSNLGGLPYLASSSDTVS
ncbi:hypothetical protein JCM5350_007818 [Sporobolomyces pararoseus]